MTAVSIKALAFSFVALVLAVLISAVVWSRSWSTVLPPPRSDVRELSRIDYEGAYRDHARANAFGVDDDVLGNLRRSEIDRQALPILIPTNPLLMGNARLYSMGDHYTISADLPGVSVVLGGYSATVALADQIALSPQGPEDLVISHTTDGVAASFKRYGVLYTIEVTCDETADQHCEGESFIRILAEGTNNVILGEAARVAATPGV